VTLFVIGAVLAFLTPLGGIPLLIGSIGFLLTVLTTSYEEVNVTIWFGSATAIISATMVIGSLVTPLGIGYKSGGENRIAARLLTWSLYRD
jgi:hypothetical protein